MPDNPLGIDRGHYVALRTPDPESAAKFAASKMGMDLVHSDAEGRQYLSAHGLDDYSLVYTPGEAGIDHISYLVDGEDSLRPAADKLAAAGLDARLIDESDLWQHGPAVRVSTPNGIEIELSTGKNVTLPMQWMVEKPDGAPAPICFDHAIIRTTDVEALIEFAGSALGLKESGRIVTPDGTPFLSFWRSHTLFHCFGTNASDRNGLHHVQFTLKNDRAVLEAHEAMAADDDVEIIWGPLRHGCGQNITFYFFDGAGNIIEYSAEEELILNDDTYSVNHWPITDIRATNEWSGDLPPAAMK